MFSQKNKTKYFKKETEILKEEYATFWGDKKKVEWTVNLILFSKNCSIYLCLEGYENSLVNVNI